MPSRSQRALRDGRAGWAASGGAVTDSMARKYSNRRADAIAGTSTGRAIARLRRGEADALVVERAALAYVGGARADEGIHALPVAEMTALRGEQHVAPLGRIV